MTGLRDGEYLISSVALNIDEYYAGVGESPGGWAGRLGLSGVVEPDQLRNLVDSLDPLTGEPLVSGRARSVRAFDVTLSAPKSVSLLWALGSGPAAEAVAAAHREAVGEALGFLEERAAVARHQSGGVRRRVPTRGFVVAGFVHRTSREGNPTPGLWQGARVVRSYRRRRLWGIGEEAIDVFDELVALVTSPDGGADDRRRDLLTFVLDDLVGPDDAAGHALIHATPMLSGVPAAGEAREWIVDVLATAARQMENQWWDGFDERGDPVIHGRPYTRLRNRSGLARLVLDRRIELMLSQSTVAEACRVVQGWVQAWEAGVRIPDASELDALAGVLELNRAELAGAETGSAVYRNELGAEAQAELDVLFWGSDIKVPDLAARFGLEGRRVDKLVSPAGAGVACEDCGAEMVFTTRERRRVRFAECRTCRRPRYLDRHETPPGLSRRPFPTLIPPW